MTVATRNEASRPDGRVGETRAAAVRTNAPEAMRPTLTTDRFWAMVDASGGPEACWPWTGATRPGGYGQFENHSANRFALEEDLGRPLLAGHEAAHACDNPPCVNPAHLYEATPKRNSRDSVERGRAPQRTPRAPDTPWGRLRGARGWSLRELEARTGINAGVLSRIERGTSPTPDQARALLAIYDGAR